MKYLISIMLVLIALTTWAQEPDTLILPVIEAEYTLDADTVIHYIGEDGYVWNTDSRFGNLARAYWYSVFKQYSPIDGFRVNKNWQLVVELKAVNRPSYTDLVDYQARLCLILAHDPAVTVLWKQFILYNGE